MYILFEFYILIYITFYVHFDVFLCFSYFRIYLLFVNLVNYIMKNEEKSIIYSIEELIHIYLTYREYYIRIPNQCQENEEKLTFFCHYYSSFSTFLMLMRRI